MFKAFRGFSREKKLRVHLRSKCRPIYMVKNVPQGVFEVRTVFVIILRFTCLFYSYSVQVRIEIFWFLYDIKVILTMGCVLVYSCVFKIRSILIF